MNFRELRTDTVAADITVAGLSIWIQGRQFQDAREPSDADWLRVAASYASGAAEAWVSGPIVMSRDIDLWRRELLRMRETLSGTASLAPIEPALLVKFNATSLGHIEVTAVLRPDPLTETHEFTTEIDQSYLPSLIAQLEKVLSQFPVRWPVQAN